MKNPQRKMYITSVGLLITNAAFFVVCLKSNQVLTGDAGPDGLREYATSLSIDQQGTLLRFGALLIAIGVLLGAGVTGMKRAAGVTLIKLDESKFRVWGSGKVWAEKVRHEPNPEQGVTQQILCGLLVLLASIQVFLVVEETGGPTNSPFIQFAISGFLWAMLLNPVRKRWIVLIAALTWTILAFYLSDPSLITGGPNFNRSTFLAVTLFNLLFQFGFVVFDGEDIADSFDATGTASIGGHSSQNEPEPPDVDIMSPSGHPTNGPDTATPLLHFTGSGITALGRIHPNGFVVYAGSQAMLESDPAVSLRSAGLRTDLIEDETLVEESSHLRFTRDFIFTTPSSAASVIGGGSTHGRDKWRDAAGRSMNDLDL